MAVFDHRVEVSHHAVGERGVVLFFDVDTGQLLDDLTDYTIALSYEDQLDSKTVSNHAYHLRRFWEFLSVQRVKASDCTDQLLLEFRDHELRAVLSSRKSKAKVRIAKGTVNERLVRIYHWLMWLQKRGRVGPRLIGPSGCQVRSTLPNDLGCGVRGGAHGYKTVRQSEQGRYPILFRNFGSGSKHHTDYAPTEEVRFAAISYFHEEASSDYLAHRNALLVDVANAVGWRRASINSLTIGQVRQVAKVDSCSSGYVLLSPTSQKFGYVETFDFPAWLIVRIEHFIENYLRPCAAARGWAIDIESSNLFLSEKGTPLKDRSVTQIVAKAMRSAGAPRWTSMHAFRRKFTRDEIADETEYRLAKELDTSAASISASVSLRLGHHSPDSVYAYTSKHLTADRAFIEAERREYLATLESENLALKSQLKRYEQFGDGAPSGRRPR